MKKMTRIIALCFCFGLLLNSCTRDKCQVSQTYTKFTPVYMSSTEFREAVKSDSPKSLKHPGKMYFKDNYIFVNEYLKGIHVIDNSNPAAPQIVSFISIPGNIDIAAKGNVLYADSYTDLVAINIGNPSSITELSRITAVFDYPMYLNGTMLDASKGFPKDFIEEVVTETIVGDCGYNNQRAETGGTLFNSGPNTQNGSGGVSNTTGGGGSTPNPSSGTGGSMARFATYQDFLYVVTKSSLKIFSTADPATPTYNNDLNVGWGIETIFPYNQALFLGSTSGMFIYDVTNPSNPVQLSEFSHITSCDPVVVQGNTAYVTLRNGNSCFGYSNQLDIIDVTTLTAPVQIASHDMFNPHGLGVDAEKVFICDGTEGLKIFDASNPNQLTSLAKYSGISTFDVIPLVNQKVLLMIGDNGLFQYDYSNTTDIRLISTIPVVKE